MKQGEFDYKRGDVFAGYRIVDKLGPGVMGFVYLARDTARVRRVALKILQPGLAYDSEYFKLFEQQAAAAIEVTHKNIAKLYAAGTEKNLLYTASEFIPGKTLATLIEGQGRVDVQIALSLLLTIGKALRYLHSRGIVHGGVNPGNIRMTSMGEVKLVDVGLAKKLVLRPKDSKEKVTVTPVYLAPELVRGPGSIDARADIYSMGITAYEALTGTKPFLSSSPHETVLRIMNEPLTIKHMKDIPADVAELIARMVAKNPDNRPSDMLETVSELERIAAKHSPVIVGGSPSASTRQAMTRRAVKGRQRILSYILVATVVVATFLAFYLPSRRPQQARGTQSRTIEEQAAQALESAMTFEAQHPSDVKEALERYRRIISTFPGTGAASAAQAAGRRLSFGMTARKAASLTAEKRLYEAVMTYTEFEKHYAGTIEGSDASSKKMELLLLIEVRFNNDMLKGSRLARMGEVERAVSLLREVEIYGSPEYREKVREKIDEILSSDSVLRLQGADAATWEIAGPMLAITTRQIAEHRYEPANDSCDTFLSSPLPRGVEQIVLWEKEDISRLVKVRENFRAALGDASDRGDLSSFTLADGTVISGMVRRENGDYYLHLPQGGKWRIRAADLACPGVLKLAGMEVEEPEAVRTAALYELYHGSAKKARTLLARLKPTLQQEVFIRCRNKLKITSALLLRRTPRAGVLLDPRYIRQAAKIVEGARKLMKQKNWGQAYPLLRQAVELNPVEPAAWSLLAKTSAMKGLSVEALQYYRKSLTFNPDNPIQWNELGKLYLAQGELGLALAAFGQTARMNPADPVAVQGRVEALLRLGQEEEARRVREQWEKARQR